MRRQDQALLDHGRRREAGRVVEPVAGAAVAVEHGQALDRVELVVEGAREHVAGAGVDAEEDERREALLLELGVERQLFVDVGGADDVARAGGGVVEVVGAGLETGLHDVEVVLGDDGVDAEVDAGERLDERVLVVDVELQDLGLAGRQLLRHLFAARDVHVGEHDLVALGLAGDRARVDLADGSDAKLQETHGISSPFRSAGWPGMSASATRGHVGRAARCRRAGLARVPCLRSLSHCGCGEKMQYLLTIGQLVVSETCSLPC